MGWWHFHSWDKVKSVILVPPTLDEIGHIKASDHYLFELFLEQMKVKTSVVKQCECGALREWIFLGDHTKDFKPATDN